jgi:drug/metabolite transporter (DMT)-like permease
MTPSRPSLSLAYLALVAMMVFWGLSFVATKVALETFPTFTLVFCRFALASSFFLMILVRKGIPALSAKDHGRILLVALFEPGLYFVFETIGLQYTSAAKASLIIATVPLFVMIFAFFFLRERTNPASFLGIGVSLFGIFLLIRADPHFEWSLGTSFLGDLLIFGAVLSAALYTVTSRAAGRKSSVLNVTGLQMCYGALFYFPAFLWELPSLEWPALSTRSVAALLYLALFASIGAFFCYNYALSRIPATKASVFVNGIPVITTLAAWVLLGEKLTSLQMAGGALVLFGVYLSNRLKT